MELVTWRGTPGVGDFMWALNCAHNHSYTTGNKIKLRFYWEHGPDYLHHFEDPETIIERLEYVHNFYHRKDDVVVEHVYNDKESRYSKWKFSDDCVLMNDGRLRVAAIRRENKARFWFESGAWSDKDGSQCLYSDWIFREDAFKPRDPQKVVIWRPTFNAEIPRTWKRELTNEQWDGIINSLSAAGLYTVELTYRTPISEAIYHISTCRQVVCYDGMWHYIARNFMKPMMVMSIEGVTRVHTPHNHFPRQGFSVEGFNKLNLPDNLGESRKSAIDYEERCRQFYQDR